MTTTKPNRMKILMLSWEFPPLIAGGLAMACYGMVKSLLKLGVDIDLVLPTKQTAYFPFRKPEDADELPVILLDTPEQEPTSSNIEDYKQVTNSLSRQYQREISIYLPKLTIEEKLEYLGLDKSPQTYATIKSFEDFSSSIIKEHSYPYNNHQDIAPSSALPHINNATINNPLAVISSSLSGEEDIFKKVRDFTIKATRIALSNNDYDAIHAHDWLTYPAGMFIKHITNKPLVTHIHATEFDRSGGTGDKRIHNIEYSGMAYSDIVMAVSKYTAQMIVNRYRIEAERIQIVHNAHSTTVKSIELRQQSKRIFKGPTILFLGRITIQKGPDYFLDVAKIVLDKHPNARFIMAGTGDMARRLLHKSAAYQLKNKFLFAGFLNRLEVDLILSATDIYLLPSVSEPFGIAPLEAMAYGITAIISKQSGVSEVVENAYKIDFWDIDKMADTICYLIENPDICRDIGIKGMNEVEKIRWDDAAKLINDVYEKAVKGNK